MFVSCHSWAKFIYKIRVLYVLRLGLLIIVYCLFLVIVKRECFLTLPWDSWFYYLEHCCGVKEPLLRSSQKTTSFIWVMETNLPDIVPWGFSCSSRSSSRFFWHYLLTFKTCPLFCCHIFCNYYILLRSRFV